jgi:hypothetical protein
MISVFVAMLTATSPRSSVVISARWLSVMFGHTEIEHHRYSYEIIGSRSSLRMACGSNWPRQASAGAFRQIIFSNPTFLAVRLRVITITKRQRFLLNSH